MRPLLGSLATTRVSNAVNRIVYQAVNEAIDSGQIAYEQLVSYEKDNEGRITMVQQQHGGLQPAAIPDLGSDSGPH